MQILRLLIHDSWPRIGGRSTSVCLYAHSLLLHGTAWDYVCIKKKLVAFHKVPRTSGCALRPVFVCFLHQCYNKIAFHLLVMRQWSWLGWWMKWWVTLGATCIWSIAAVTILLTIVPALKSVLYRLILGLFMFTIISSYSQGWLSWSGCSSFVFTKCYSKRLWIYVGHMVLWVGPVHTLSAS